MLSFRANTGKTIQKDDILENKNLLALRINFYIFHSDFFL